nr:GNAT family N-acetyltransferase [Brucella intermedia]
MTSISIRPAVVEERSVLLDLQWRASLTHDAYRELLLQHPEAVDLPVPHIEDGNTLVAEVAGRIVGFAVNLRISESEMELDGLFVEPERNGEGIGRYLVQKAEQRARANGASSLMVIASPEVLGFYRQCGFEVVKETPVRFGTAFMLRKIISDRQNV